MEVVFLSLLSTALGALWAGTELRRRRALRELRAARHDLEQFESSVGQHSILVDTDRAGRIERVNDRFCELSGYTREELVGQTHRIVNSGLQPRSFWTGVWRELVQGRSWHGEVCNRRKDGRLYYVDTSISPLFDPRGQIRGFRAVRTDISGLKSSQAELERARWAAEEANQAKSRFLANMSHEIRTPLTAILGYTELLAGSDGEFQDPESRAEVLRTVESAGAHLLTIVNDVLDLSKIEAGRFEIENLDFNLPELLLGIEGLLRPRAQGKSIELRTRVLGLIPVRLRCDPTRLRQILMNLLGNALKFTEEGWVELRVQRTRVGDEEQLRFEVEDTGPGMSSEVRAELFHPFTQADNTVSRKHGGTGLGLTICKRLAEMLGGEIWIESSEPGIGSCFGLQLPVQSLPEAGECEDLQHFARPAEAAPDAFASPRLCGRILLADDAPDIRRLVSFHLRKAGAEVVAVENGELALARYEEAAGTDSAFDILVTDMQMPVLDGYRLASELRARSVAIPILALTAHAYDEDRQACLAAGCDAYVTKPLNKAELLESCATLLARSRPGNQLHA